MTRRKTERSKLRPEIWRRVDERRSELNLTLGRLAELAGISVGAVSGLRKGTRAFTDSDIERLADALEVTPAELLPGGPRPEEAPLIAAIRDGDTVQALHALADLLGMTRKDAVQFVLGLRGMNDELLGMAQAAAGLARRVADIFGDDIEDARTLFARWGVEAHTAQRRPVRSRADSERVLRIGLRVFDFKPVKRLLTSAANFADDDAELRAICEAAILSALEASAEVDCTNFVETFTPRQSKAITLRVVATPNQLRRFRHLIARSANNAAHKDKPVAFQLLLALDVSPDTRP